MIIVMAPGALKKHIKDVVSEVNRLGYQDHIIQGTEKTVIAAIGDERGKFVLQSLESMPEVEQVIPILKPFKLASLEVTQSKTSFRVGKVVIGGKKVVCMAGPCSVESEKQIMTIAAQVKKAGASILRGGAFKPRTSPYDFQGMGEDGLKILQQAGREYDMPVITEVTRSAELELVEKYADIIQIGARNSQNFGLLKEVGMSKKPVLLKRGVAGTLKELLMSAEYILSQGNYKVMLCERGIRTFETATRNTFDLNAIPYLKSVSHLPVIADPSHGTGLWNLVGRVSYGAVAAGADGLIVEVHNDPSAALSDGPQSLLPDTFRDMMKHLRAFAKAAGRTA